MWWKRKLFLFGLCLQLMLLTIFSLGGTAKAAANNNATDGFIIQADRVEGTGMFASIVEQETSSKTGKEPMLRIQYQSATIYGMRLTKQMETPNGMVSITLKANGPVTVKGMTVDTTAISFKGACLTASDTIPELAMENVTMVAHYMDNQASDINKLVLNTVSGGTPAGMPGRLQILQDLSQLPLNQLNEEIGKITSGHLPLTCVDPSKTGGQSGGISSITDPIKGIIGPVTGALNPITKTLDPITKTLDPITNTLDPITKTLDPITKTLDPITKTIDPVTKTLDPVLKPVAPVLKPLDPVIKKLDPIVQAINPVVNQVTTAANQLNLTVKQAAPIVSGSTAQINQTLPSACTQISNANGVITKQLALNVIDEALAKNLTLSTVCQSNPSETAELLNWQDGLLKSLGLVDIFGKLVPIDPVKQLTQMRDQMANLPDGTIVYQP